MAHIFERSFKDSSAIGSIIKRLGLVITLASHHKHDCSCGQRKLELFVHGLPDLRLQLGKGGTM